MNVNQVPSEPSPDAGDAGQRTPSPSPGGSASRDVPLRRWLSVAGVGLFCAAIGATAGCGDLVPKYTASSQLRVASREPVRVFESTHTGQAEFDVYKATQKELMRSDFVLVAALRKPEIAKLAVFKQQDDPVAWLSGELRVEFPDEAEIMEVSLTLDDPDQAAALVNAVVEAYLEEVVQPERNQLRQRLNDLERISVKKETEVRKKRANLRQLAEQLGLGTRDHQALRLKQQIAQKRFFDTQRELTQLRSDLRRTQTELKVRKAMLADPEGIKLPEFEIDAFMQSDPVTAQLLTPLLTELKKQLAAGQPEENLQRGLKAVQKELDARREELRPQLRQRKRAAIEAEIARLKDQITVLSELCQKITEDVKEQKKEAERFGETLLDIEMMRAELTQLDEVLNSVATERERLRVEVNSSPRIMLMQRAEPPRSKD